VYRKPHPHCSGWNFRKGQDLRYEVADVCLAAQTEAPADAKEIDLAELKKMKDMGELPSNFVIGGEQ